MNIFKSLVTKTLDKLTLDIAIDLGTSSTLIAIKGLGIVSNDPSVVAINKNTNKILAVGTEAKKMVGRTPTDIVAIRPLKDGVIKDFDVTEAMLKYFIKKGHDIALAKASTFTKKMIIARPRIVVGVPSQITEVEKRAVMEAGLRVGAREVYIIEEPMAAAIGMGLPVEEAVGSMLIDIGGGTSDIAIISLGEIVVDETINIAGDEVDEEIVRYIKERFSLQIGLATAEKIKIEISNMDPLSIDKRENTQSKEKSEEVGRKESEKDEIIQRDETNILQTDIIDDNLMRKFLVKGRDTRTSLPKEIYLEEKDLFPPLNNIIMKIAVSAKNAIDKCPPELLADIMTSGVKITGGGAMIKNIDKYFAEKLGCKVESVVNPVETVVEGCLRLLDNINFLRKTDSISRE